MAKTLEGLKAEINREESMSMVETRVRFPFAENVARGSEIKAYLVKTTKMPNKQLYVCFREDGQLLDKVMEEVNK